jgi:hypothetical protein
LRENVGAKNLKYESGKRINQSKSEMLI